MCLAIVDALALTRVHGLIRILAEIDDLDDAVVALVEVVVAATLTPLPGGGPLLLLVALHLDGRVVAAGLTGLRVVGRRSSSD